MFTGIIEEIGAVTALEREGQNLDIWVRAGLAAELHIDQSVAHNGACLTVVELAGDRYRVTAVAETLARTSLGDLAVGDALNLERAMILGARLDGHLVQGHVDATATCTGIEPADGSHLFRFAHEIAPGHVTLEKGSITVDGVSLTVVDSAPDGFSVAIIPYTYEHTRFRDYRPGSRVNLEFDLIGKYVARLMEGR